VYCRYAAVIESTKDANAEEPAHSEMTNPTETMELLPWVRMSATVGRMIWSTTSALNTVVLNRTISRCAASTVAGPNQSATNPRLPSSPSNSGGSDSVIQKAAWADIATKLSSHALTAVREIRRSNPRRTRVSVSGAAAVRPVPAVGAAAESAEASMSLPRMVH
jgi:hypothetical protein